MGEPANARPVRYERLRAEWADELAALERATFTTTDPDDLYDADELRALATEFPEGCFVALDAERPVAMGLGVRVDFDLDAPQHRITDIVAAGTSGHDPNGDWYYGTDICVHPAYRRHGIGRRLYDLRKGVCRDQGVRGIVAGGVIPGYAEHKARLTPDEYIADVRAGRLYDRTLSFQLENGFEALCALPGYMRDPDVDDAAALIVWHNPERT
jgi:ribosomal protein S18 acetylase RimI-like enzyme